MAMDVYVIIGSLHIKKLNNYEEMVHFDINFNLW